MQRALSDFPFLGTAEGKPVLNKIIARRDMLIWQGTYPSIALTQAVNENAPAYAATYAQSQERRSQASQEARNEGERAVNHNAFPPTCRWVTPKDWSCN